MEATIKGERITFDFLSSNKFDKALKEDVQDNMYSQYYNGISALNKIFPWIGDLSKKLSRNISFVHDSYIPGNEFNKKRCYDLFFRISHKCDKNVLCVNSFYNSFVSLRPSEISCYVCAQK
ncbi:VIR protein [Plasmodium vivax]|uniref:VIR protein n=1 Tax=Plasmodium vivax TaxID=5855 RepID=A0A1G4GTZ0_PLAVI|nr:VIR protein [Plasmodium vivax]